MVWKAVRGTSQGASEATAWQAGETGTVGGSERFPVAHDPTAGRNPLFLAVGILLPIPGLLGLAELAYRAGNCPWNQVAVCSQSMGIVTVQTSYRSAPSSA
jgi:hypothetical protein